MTTLFKLKRPIQLGTESNNTSQRSLRSSWSIPCCANLSLIKGPAIQLPDDSDNEQDEYDQPEETPNIFSQHNNNTLSRNPFARVPEPETRTEIQIVENLEQVVDSGEEELADFSNRSVLIESYTEEEQQEEEEESMKGFDLKEEGEDVQQDTTQDKVPQIEDDVLKMLPLPHLSTEIPPAMIHEDPSSSSRYSELPLMSTSLNSQKRVSRFSMSEEEYVAFKKSQEADKNIPKKQENITEQAQKEPLLQEQVALHDQVVPQLEKHERRASAVTTAAHAILGDKLEDFTEKLAFIKKNIIMSEDSDDEEVENAEQMLKVIEQQKLISTEQPKVPILHRRASSLMDVTPSLSKFMNQMAGSTEDPTPTPSSSSNTFSASSLFSVFAGPEPTATVDEEGEEEVEDEEEIFDFTKVIEIGKNVKTFGQDVVGNGLRMFNDVATRVKNSVEQEQAEKQEYQTAHKNDGTPSTPSTNENEWMHNYL